eukprot:2965898-Prymnesium_polylepis.1
MRNTLPSASSRMHGAPMTGCVLPSLSVSVDAAFISFVEAERATAATKSVLRRSAVCIERQRPALCPRRLVVGLALTFLWPMACDAPCGGSGRYARPAVP